MLAFRRKQAERLEKKSLLDQMTTTRITEWEKKPQVENQVHRGSYVPTTETFVYPNRLWKIIVQMVIVCLSPFYVGVTIFLSVAYSFQSYQRYYNFSSYPYLFTFCVLNACVPLGGIVGSLSFPMMIRNAGKTNIGYVCIVTTVVFGLITLVPLYQVMIFGRFLLGITCSWQNTYAAILIKDLTPMQYRAAFGGLFYTARISGITFSCLFAVIFWWELNDLEICLINMLPLYIVVIQVILLKLFVNENPADLSRFNQAGLRPYFQKYYAPKDVDKAIQNCIREFKTMEALHSFVNAGKSQTEKEEATKIYNNLMTKILYLSLQVSALRQIVAVNYVTPYAQTLLQTMGCNFIIILSGPVFINLVQIAASLAGMYICHLYGRRPILLIGVAGALVGTLLLGITNYYLNNIGQIVSMVIYMIFVGGFLQPVAWSYGADLLLIAKIPLSNVASWAGGSLVAGTPVRSQIYQFMFAISVYLFINLIILYYTAIQIKQTTTRQIMSEVMLTAYAEVNKRSNLVSQLTRMQMEIEQKSQKDGETSKDKTQRESIK